MRRLLLSWLVAIAGLSTVQAQMQWWPTEVQGTAGAWVAEGPARFGGVAGVGGVRGVDDTSHQRVGRRL